MKSKLFNLVGCLFLVTAPLFRLAAADELQEREIKREEVIAERKGNEHINGSAELNQESVASEKKIYFLYGAEHLHLKNYYFDIPVLYNDAVKKWVHYFSNNGRDLFVRYSELSGRYAPVLGKILEDHGLPRDLIFLAMAESGFQNGAKSWASAVGPWQFMDFTARKYGLKLNWFIDERKDPIKATIAASRYLKKLYNQFGTWELSATAYNAGEGKVTKAIKLYNTRNFWKLREGRFLKDETKDYVPKIMALAIIGKNLESFGMEQINFEDPLNFDEIELPGNTDLVAISKELDIPFDTLKRYNPELLRPVTPTNGPAYILRVPSGKKDMWASCCASKQYLALDFKIPNNPDLFEKSERKKDKNGKNHRSRIKLTKDQKKREKEKELNSHYYVVQKGDTLWHVSKKVGVPLKTLAKSNFPTGGKARKMQIGDKLLVY